MPTVLPQERVYVQRQEGVYSECGRFVKRVENNILMLDSVFNFDSKDAFEKLFFGDFNAFVEFLYDPARDGGAGFRIIKSKSNTSYILEIKSVSNYEEAKKETSKYKFQYQYAEMLKLFKIETCSFSISHQFVEELHKKMVSCIDNFKVKGIPRTMKGGYSVVFRNVVDDEVWSLRIRSPKGDALKMSDL
jgi:hypothetical protein